MTRKLRLRRTPLFLSLSLVYACQGSQTAPSSLQKPLPVPSSSSQANTVPQPSASPELRIQGLNEAEIAEIKANPVVAANNRFALKFLSALSEEQAEKNLFVSPLSVSLALQMTWNGARGETKAEMAKALGIDNLKPEEVNRGASLLMRKLVKPAEDIQLEVANGIFANDRFEILPEFIQKNQENFFSEVRTLHFANGPTQAEINAWVNQQTHQKIPQLLEPVDPDPDWEVLTVMYLLNALYFKADWSRKFEEFETQKRNFTLSNGNLIQVPMMRQFGPFHYLAPGNPTLKNDFQAIELPYGQTGKVSMYLFLPSYGSSLTQLRKDLNQMDLETLFQSFGTEVGSLTLPKFKQDWKSNLFKSLNSLGMYLAFDKDHADFFDLAKPRFPGEKFYLSEVVQKSQIEVNEKGTTASAVTYVEVSVPVSSEPQRALEMICNRPFLYLIRDNQTSQILFVGQVYDPSLIPSGDPAAENSKQVNSPDRYEDIWTPQLAISYPHVDVSVMDRTTINGKIFDENHAPIDGATVKIRSLINAVPFEVETYSTHGTYALNKVPSGNQIEIEVSKPGYTVRRRIEVLKSNNQGDPNANRYDFGNDGINKQYSADYYALSDKPEVISSTPARNGSNIDPLTSFVLKFSKPMDRQSVEDTFSIYSFNAPKLSVDAGNPSRIQTLKGNANLSTNFLPGNSTLIWDKDAFNISWNSDDTEVVFAFKEGLQLPSDRNRQNLPDYNLAFYNSSTGNHTLKDKQGNSRSDKHFKLTEGEFEESLSFSIQTDEKAPELRSLKAETAENGSGQGDLLRVRYSEPMIFYLRELPIAGGMENISGAELKAPAAYPGSSVVTGLTTALNYSTTITQTGGTTRYAGPWGALGGTAIYDSTDPTHHTVLLLPPSYTQPTLAHVWLTGSTLLTAAGDYHSDGNANTAGVFTLLRSQSLAPVDLSFNLNSNLATAQALAADLQNALNTAAAAANPPASAQAFQVSAEASGQLKIQFNDSSGNYVGFAVKTDVTGQATDQLPVLRTGGQTLQNGSLLDLLQPGDKLQLKVRESVSDPAGNTLDSQHSTVSGNAS